MQASQILVETTISSKWGDLTLYCSDLGVASLVLPKSKAEVDKYLQRYFGKYRIIDEQSALSSFAEDEIKHYLAGELKRFDSPCDLRLTPFASRVLSELQQIPYGETITYGELAARCDNPKASRAVGWAMAHNPIPLIIPCHRVINADGKVGSYAGGVRMKKGLLDLEKKHQ